MLRLVQLDRELRGAWVQDGLANPRPRGLIEGVQLVLRTNQDCRRVVQAKVPHGLTKLEHPLRGGLDSGKGIALGVHLQASLDDLLDSR